MENERSEEATHPLVAATGHAVKREILRHFREHPSATATEIAELSGLPKSTVAEHVRSLRSEGLIAEDGQEKKRGTLGRLYSNTERANWLSNDEWEELSPRQKAAFINGLIRSLRTYLAAAMRATGGDFTPDSCWGTTLYTVDEKGWAELAELHLQMMSDTDRIADESRQRLAADPNGQRQVCSTLYFFEMPDDDASPMGT